MKLQVSIILGALALVTSGCASDLGNSGSNTEVSQPASDIICKKERQIGSKIPVKVCRTRAQVEAEEEIARRNMEQIQGGANVIGSGP